MARPAAPAPNRGPIEKKDPQEIKGDVKMRKLEVMTKQLLGEFLSLAEDRQEDAWASVTEKFVARVPGKYLAFMSEKFSAVTTVDDIVDANNIVIKAPAEKPPPEKKAAAAAPPAKKLKQELPAKSPATQSPATKSMQAVTTPKVDSAMWEVKKPDRFEEAMQAMLQAEPHDWKTIWAAQKISTKDQSSALAALGQAAAKAGDIDSVCTLFTTLAGAKLVHMSAIEAALAALAANLEELVGSYENAWHLHSQSLHHFFPRSDHSSWGFQEKTWTWNSWWQMVERVLSKSDNFRAFDILVLVLQMMQEASGLPVKEQQVWKESGRVSKVRKVLCTWGDMDEKSILETLSAYGVEL